MNSLKFAVPRICSLQNLYHELIVINLLYTMRWWGAGAGDLQGPIQVVPGHHSIPSTQHKADTQVLNNANLRSRCLKVLALEPGESEQEGP